MIIDLISVGFSELHIIQYISNLVFERFRITVRTGKQISIDNFEIDKFRNQYLSTQILESLIDMKNSNEDIILGVADVDLYTPSLNFIFGEADPKNRVALISITRLKPSFYVLKSVYELLLNRAGKEAVHELGHIFNLSHCSNERCVMFFSNSLIDTDMKKDDFCNKCKAILNTHL